MGELIHHLEVWEQTNETQSVEIFQKCLTYNLIPSSIFLFYMSLIIIEWKTVKQTRRTGKEFIILRVGHYYLALLTCLLKSFLYF